jgi:hypothetical protein
MDGKEGVGHVAIIAIVVVLILAAVIGVVSTVLFLKEVYCKTMIFYCR